MKPLPHNREAEAAVLAGVLLAPALLDDVSGELVAESFYVPAHKVIWRAMLRLSDRGEAIDPVTLEHQLRANGELGLVGGLEGLGKISDRYASSRAVVQHAKIVASVAAQRRLVETCERIVEEGREIQENVTSWIDGAQRQIMEASTNQASSGKGYKFLGAYVHDEVGFIVEQARAAKQARVDGKPVPLTGLRTGYEKLDDKMSGLQPTNLIVLAARPAMGKTAFALNVTQNIAGQGEPVLVFSMEMSTRQLSRRAIFSEARVNGKKVRNGELLEGDMASMFRAATALQAMPIAIDERPAQSITAIRSEARRWRKDPRYFPSDGRKRTGMVVVDYLQLGQTEDGQWPGRKDLEIAAISGGLKALAKELELPVLALSQLNRGVDARPNKRPMLSDLRDSGAIEQDADDVLFLYRHAVYMPDDTAERAAEKMAMEHEAEVIIGKQRGGEIGTVHMVWKGEYTRFENMDYHR